jgi:hypothetical protein
MSVALAAEEIVVEGDDEPVIPRSFQSLEAEPGFVPPEELQAPDIPRSAPELVPGRPAADEAPLAPVLPPPPVAEPLFAPARAQGRKGKAGVGAGHGLSVGLVAGWALGLLTLIVLVEVVANRTAIVGANPQLAGAYRAIGLPVDTGRVDAAGRGH